MNWYDSRENLMNLAAYLINKDGEIDVVDFLEKPWKWNSEWNELQGESYTFQKEELEKELGI